MTHDSTMTAGEGSMRRRPLGDLTLTQVVASALAAVTSLALSRHIGVAGSLIGAAVGSVAASVAGALYRSAITTSVERVRSAARRDAAFPLLAALACGVLAVGAFAFCVNAATEGQGIGTKAPIIQAASAQAPADEETATEPEAAATEADPEAAATEAADPEAAANGDAATTDGISQQEVPSEPATDTIVGETACEETTGEALPDTAAEPTEPPAPETTSATTTP